MIITFTDTSKKMPEEFYPRPASNFVPEWYKEMPSYRTPKKDLMPNGQTAGTIKRCMPVFDAIVSGYIIVSAADVLITQAPNENGDIQPYYRWPNFGLLDFHPVEQAPKYPGNKGHKELYPKWINPWSVKTPKGYSVLFTQPMHRESVFTILDGIVDTDTYTAPVNFPFVLNDINFEGMIPAGTPIAQVIPFKRDSWQMQLGNKKDIEEQEKISEHLRSRFFDSYKNIFRQKKEYK